MITVYYVCILCNLYCDCIISSSVEFPPYVEIRLAGGKNPSEGRVEILYNERWGTVCDDDWDNFAAQVVCRQAGYLYVLRSTLEFGAGNGTIWLDNVGCTGNESSILECNHGGLGQHNCVHSEDIGVVCSSKLHVTWSNIQYCTSNMV